MEEHMNVAEVAAYLDVAKSTIYRWIKEDRIPRHRLGHWVYRFSKEEIDAWQVSKLASKRGQR